MSNSKNTSLDLFFGKVTTDIAWRQTSQSECQWHQIKKFFVTSLDVCGILVAHLDVLETVTLNNASSRSETASESRSVSLEHTVIQRKLPDLANNN